MSIFDEIKTWSSGVENEVSAGQIRKWSRTNAYVQVVSVNGSRCRIKTIFTNDMSISHEKEASMDVLTIFMFTYIVTHEEMTQGILES